MKAFRRDKLTALKLSANRFTFEPEITAKAARAGWRIYEVPISYSGRTYDEGKKVALARCDRRGRGDLLLPVCRLSDGFFASGRSCRIAAGGSAAQRRRRRSGAQFRRRRDPGAWTHAAAPRDGPSRGPAVRSGGRTVAARTRGRRGMLSDGHPQRARPEGRGGAKTPTPRRALRRGAFPYFARACDGAVGARPHARGSGDTPDGLRAQPAIRADCCMAARSTASRQSRPASPTRSCAPGSRASVSR